MQMVDWLEQGRPYPLGGDLGPDSGAKFLPCSRRMPNG